MKARLTLWGDSIPFTYRFNSVQEAEDYFWHQVKLGDWKKCRSATIEEHDGTCFNSAKRFVCEREGWRRCDFDIV
jgi:hypothetical protein